MPSDEPPARRHSLRLLGTPFAQLGGTEHPIINELPQRLLAYLALSDNWVEREDIAEMFWPTLLPERRLANLRRALGRAKTLPWAAGLEAERSRLRWRVETDVAAFEAGEEPAAVLGLWRGPLLDGMREDEDGPSTNWLTDERLRLEARFGQLTLQHADDLIEAQPASAAELLENLLQRDPLDEEVVQRLMNAHAAAGRPGQARAVYRRFAALLESELGLEPLNETRRLLGEVDVAAQEPEATGGDVLGSLSEGARRVLEAASLAVAPFTLEQVAPATALSAWLAVEGLEQAVNAGLVVAEPNGYRFTHESLRLAVSGRLGSERRALIEQRLALALERVHGPPALIAGHFDRAGRNTEALRWHQRAAEDAIRLALPSVALEHLERAAELADQDSALVSIYLQQAKLLDGMVDHPGRERMLALADACALRLEDRVHLARVALDRADYATTRGEAGEAMAQAERALELRPNGPEAARAHYTRARVLLLKGPNAATAEVEDALRRAEAELPPGPSALRGALYLKGFFALAYWSGDMNAAAAHLDVAIESLEETGQQAGLAEALNRRGVISVATGDRDGALRSLNDALAIARDSGVVWTHRGIILNLLKVHTDAADVEAAVPLVEEGLALAHDFAPYSEASFLLAVGYVRYLQGELGAAGRVWERAAQVADASGHRVARVAARFPPFHVHLRSGDLGRCRDLLGQVAELLESEDSPLLRSRLEVKAARLAVEEGRPRDALDLVAPWSARTDVEAEERADIGLVQALAHLTLGEPRLALDRLSACEDGPSFEITLAALALKLRLLKVLGLSWRETAAAAQTKLESGRVTPFEAVDLLSALAEAHDACGEHDAGRRLAADAGARRERLQASMSVGVSG